MKTTYELNRGHVQHHVINQHYVELFKEGNLFIVRLSEWDVEKTAEFTMHNLVHARKKFSSICWKLAKGYQICYECGGAMLKGVALQQNYSGIGDFHDGDAVCTISPDGTATMVECLKCASCGHSESK